MVWRPMLCAALLAFCALLLAGCASAPKAPYFAPQVTIMGANAEDAKIRIIQKCVSGSGVIEQNLTTSLICAITMPRDGAGFWYRVLMVPSYATEPKLKARYSISQGSDRVYITVDTFVHFQNAFGQTTEDAIRNAEVSQRAQAMLDEIRTDLEINSATASSATVAPDVPATQALSTSSGADSQARPTRYEPAPAKRCDSCQRIRVP